MSADDLRAQVVPTPDTPASDVTGGAVGASGGEVAPGATGGENGPEIDAQRVAYREYGAPVEGADGGQQPFLRFEGMTWPNPSDPNGVQWRLRYGTPTRADQLVAASFMHAYAHLIDMPRREREVRVRQIRAAVEGADGGQR